MLMSGRSTEEPLQVLRVLGLSTHPGRSASEVGGRFLCVPLGQPDPGPRGSRLSLSQAHGAV